MEAVRDTTVDLESILIDRKADQFRKFVTPYHGIPGKGSAFRTIFEIARDLNVKACAVVDSDLRSITPEWIELLIKPVLEDHYDYVSPYYMRHKYDGTITNSIVYPLTRALTERGSGSRSAAISIFGRLASFISQRMFGKPTGRFGIDIYDDNGSGQRLQDLPGIPGGEDS